MLKIFQEFEAKKEQGIKLGEPLFSTRDKLKYKDKENKSNSSYNKKDIFILFLLVFIISFIFFFIDFKIIIYSAINKFHFSENFLNSSSTVLAFIITISFTTLFFYYESNSKKFPFLRIETYIKDKIIISLILLFIVTMSIILLGFLFNSILLKFLSLLLTFISLISTPFFFFRCHKINDKKKIIYNLEIALDNSLRNKKIGVAEEIIHNIGFILIKAIEDRDRYLIKRSTESLYDIAKGYISTSWEFKHKYTESVFVDDKISSYSNWFLIEILNYLESAFYLCNKNNLINFNSYIYRAFTSLGQYNFNYKENTNETEIISNYILNLTSTYFSNIRLSKNNSIEHNLRHYLESSIKIEKQNFDFFLHNLLREDFIINTLKSNPYKISIFINSYLNEFQHSESIQSPNLINAKTLVDIAYNIYFISNKLDKMKVFTPESKYFNKHLRNALEESIVILILILIFHHFDEEAKKIKSKVIKDKLFNDKSVLKKLQENIKQDYFTKQYFRRYIDNNEKEFSEKEFETIVEKYKNIK